MILSSWGSAWGTWRAGMGVCSMGVDHPKGVIKNIVPSVRLSRTIQIVLGMQSNDKLYIVRTV